jgi:nicotinamide mononucleotide adenylyltransferase
MRTVVIYPGRFHPFHRGHKSSYDYLVKKYGADSVFVVSSDKQDADKSPFSFADKMDMMTKLGDRKSTRLNSSHVAILNRSRMPSSA